MDKTKTCQLCLAPNCNPYIDGRVRATGSWAYMCTSCHEEHGVGFGVGKGQRYLDGKQQLQQAGSNGLPLGRLANEL